MSQRVASQRFRQRKLSTKQNLSVLREKDIEPLIDDDASRHMPKVETGVEKGEEIEHHLQAVISAAQAAAQGGTKIAQLYIPTPEAVTSKLQYDDLYPRHFTQPATYIRFSSTVEDTIGCPYCMTSDDVAFLKAYNQKRGKGAQCSEDEFEEVMNFFEETTQTKQPFAAVDNPPVLSYEDLAAEFDETISDSARRFAKDIYEHWKNRRLAQGNRALLPSLKFETNLETDDSDPYVCFRRREVRQVRKTRGRDAQVTEKLKKLRKELEEARLLMSHVKRREVMIREQLGMEKLIFEQRSAVKEIKRKLGVKEHDEELLINQKVRVGAPVPGAVLTHQPAPKPKPRVDVRDVRVGIPGMANKPQGTRGDGRLLDSDLQYLDDQQAKKHEVIDGFIEEHLMKHQKWNIGWVDQTWRPITPPLEQAAAKSEFRRVFTSSQLPTPPGSTSSDEAAANPMSVKCANKQVQPQQGARIRYGTPPDDVPFQDQSRFRRRVGRGGRTMIDRRGVKRQKLDAVDERVADRWKFSGDSSEDEQVYPVDWTDNMHIRYRIMIDRQAEKQHAQQAAAVAAAQTRKQIDNHNRSASGHLMPPSSAG